MLESYHRKQFVF